MQGGQGGGGHLGRGNRVVDRLAVWEAAGQAGGLPTKSESQGEVEGEPGVANLASNISQRAQRRDLRNFFPRTILHYPCVYVGY